MIKFISNFTAIFFLTILVASCDNSTIAQNVSDYEKLCTIYGEFVHGTGSEDTKMIQLTERIKKEAPKAYSTFQNMALVDRSEKYKMYKKIAESETHKSWDCKVMEDYFSGKFDLQEK